MSAGPLERKRPTPARRTRHGDPIPHPRLVRPPMGEDLGGVLRGGHATPRAGRKHLRLQIGVTSVPRIAALVLVAALQACTIGPDTELTLEVDSSDPAVVAETARVLAARFREFRPSLFSSAGFAIEGSRIHFTFRNAAPE